MDFDTLEELAVKPAEPTDVNVVVFVDVVGDEIVAFGGDVKPFSAVADEARTGILADEVIMPEKPDRSEADTVVSRERRTAEHCARLPTVPDRP